VRLSAFGMLCSYARETGGYVWMVHSLHLCWPATLRCIVDRGVLRAHPCVLAAAKGITKRALGF
jgi:hypothetical protein